MSRVESEIKVKFSEYRPCLVDGEKKALFHNFTRYADVVGESALIGGHPAGQIEYTLALIEYKDGTVAEIEPYRIRFLDNLFSDYNFNVYDRENKSL